MSICRNASGQSIASVLVGAAIMGITMMAFSSMLGYQAKETKALEEKLNALELRSLLTSVLADGSVCQFELSSLASSIIDISTPSKLAASILSFNQLHASPASTSPVVVKVGGAPTPTVAGIRLTDISGTGTTLTANWEIAFDNTKLVRPLKPIKIPTALTVDITNPLATKVLSCGGGGGGGAGSVTCPSGQLMKGINPNGTPVCTTTTDAGAPCAVSGSSTYLFGLPGFAFSSGKIKGITSTGPFGRCCMVGGIPSLWSMYGFGGLFSAACIPEPFAAF